MWQMLWDERGQDIPEYTLIIVLVLIAAATYLSGLGNAIATKVQDATNWISGAG